MPGPYAPGTPGYNMTYNKPAAPAAGGSLWTYDTNWKPPADGNLIEMPAKTQTTAADASKALFTKTPNEVAAIQDKLFRAGLFGNTPHDKIIWGQARDPDTMDAYAKVLNYASVLASKSGQPVTIETALSDMARFGDVSGAGKAAQPYKGPKTTKTTSLTTPDDAYGALLQSMTNLLGRAPTSAEVSKFQGVLNAAEKASPAVETTTPTFGGPSGNEVISASVKRSGGVDRGVEAAKFTQANNGQEGASYSFWNLMRTFEKELRGGG